MTDPESAPPVDQNVNELLRKCEPFILKLVKHRLRRRTRHVHDDVAQACRLHLWRFALPKYDPLQSPLDAFVRMCCDRVIYTEARKLDSAIPLTNDIEDEPAAAPDLNDQLDRLHDSLGDSLTDGQDKILRLLLAGVCSRGIAEELGIAPASASQAIGRLRRKIYPHVVEVAA